MRDKRIDQLAKILVNNCLAVQKKERISIKTTSVWGLSLLEACYEQSLLQGALPDYRVGNEHLSEFFYKNASKQQLQNPPQLAEYEANFFDKHLTIVADENINNLSSVAGEKIALRSRLNHPVKKIIMDKPWVLTYLPTPATAQAATLSTSEMEDFYFGATLIDWQKMSQMMEKIGKLVTNKKLRIEGKKTNLTLSTSGKKWITDDWKCNMPGGEVFTSPVLGSVEGKIYFDYPLTRDGKEIKDIELTFEKGRVIGATASTNEEYLHQLLNTDEGAKGVGEIAIGVNEGCTRFMNNTLFDEKMAGTIHLALGAGFPETGLESNVSALHLDIIKNMQDKDSAIYANDKLIFETGKIIL